jgi:hypothetical protein
MTEFQFTGSGSIDDGPAMTFTKSGAASVARSRKARVREVAERVGPVLAPTALLLAARWWNVQGAEHSTGDAIISGLLTAGSMAVGTVSALNAEAGLTKGAAIGFSLAGAFAAAGITAYAGGLALPVLLWTVASGVALKLAGLARAAEWRRKALAAEREAERIREDERREIERQAAHDRAMQHAELRARTKLGIAALDAYAKVTVAELEANTAITVAELKAGHGHAILPGTERAALPDQPGRRELAALLAGQQPAEAEVLMDSEKG